MTAGSAITVRALPGDFGAVEVIGFDPEVDLDDAATADTRRITCSGRTRSCVSAFLRRSPRTRAARLLRRSDRSRFRSAERAMGRSCVTARIARSSTPGSS